MESENDILAIFHPRAMYSCTVSDLMSLIKSFLNCSPSFPFATVEKICFTSQNQPKRGLGYEGCIYGEIIKENLDIRFRGFHYLINKIRVIQNFVRKSIK